MIILAWIETVVLETNSGSSYKVAVFSLEIASQVHVDALYGLGQLLISLACTMNTIIAIQTKWC